jgi:adenylosuccinate lyase
LVKAGVSRDDAHEWLRDNSLQAWQAMRETGENPLVELIQGDERIVAKMPASSIPQLLSAHDHTGTAQTRALQLAQQIRQLTLA